MTVIYAIAALINASAAGLWAGSPPSTARVVWIFVHMSFFAVFMGRALRSRV